MRLQLILVILFCAGFLVRAQSPVDSLTIDSLKQDKYDPVTVNFIFSYYEQDGVNSPVTGGIGDERLKDYVGKINVTVPVSEKVDITGMVGMDYYTSASTDNINNEFDANPEESSASYSDQRIYGDFGFSTEIKKKRNYYYGLDAGFSTEWDVNSVNGGGFFAFDSKDENRQYKFQGMYYHDLWDLIYPSELRVPGGPPLLDVNVKELYDFSFTYTSVITRRMRASLSLEGVYQKGLLSTPFHRVYFTDTTHTIEHLPKERYKLPVGIRVAYYLSDFIIAKLFYRYYWDSFGIQAHTAEAEFPLKIGKSFRLNPFYRYHTQTASTYFQPFAATDISAVFFTSDYDLSAFTAHKFGISLKYSPLFGVFNRQSKYNPNRHVKFDKSVIRVSKYYRINPGNTTILKAFIATLSINFSID